MEWDGGVTGGGGSLTDRPIDCTVAERGGERTRMHVDEGKKVARGWEYVNARFLSCGEKEGRKSRVGYRGREKRVGELARSEQEIAKN